MSRKVIALSAVLLAGLLAAAVLATRNAPADRAIAHRAAPVPPLIPVRVTKPRPSPRKSAFAVERVKRGHRVALHARPDGPVIARVGSRTEFGSPQTLAVAARHGNWVGVINEDVKNGRVAWVKSRTRALETKETRLALRVDLARKRLELLDGHRVERRVRVGVGRPGSPTPRGRFSITDKLPGHQYGSAYGCCILGLSGRQPNTPGNWRGGNRLAIHGTDNPGTIGRRASLGCLHADARDMKLLMRRVPLGTPVFIR